MEIKKVYVHDLVFKVVQDFVQNKKEFSAFDVTKKVRDLINSDQEIDCSKNVEHDFVKSLVHNIMNSLTTLSSDYNYVRTYFTDINNVSYIKYKTENTETVKTDDNNVKQANKSFEELLVSAFERVNKDQTKNVADVFSCLFK